MMNERPVVCIDGTALLFRAYFSMPPRQARDGTEVNGVVGFFQLLREQLRLHRPEKVAVVFDSGQKTFRNEIAPDYKANRPDPPEDLVPQFDLVRQAAALLGLAVFGVLNYEADDLMATLARSAREAGQAALLVSQDKDLYQLVYDEQPGVGVYDPHRRRYFRGAGVREKMGVDPRQVIDFQALVGDSTDNIRGVAGIGPKTAVALLTEFGTLESVYQNLDRVAALPIRGAKGIVKKLETGREAWPLAKKLVTLHDRVPLGKRGARLLESLKWPGWEAQHPGGNMELREFLEYLNFHPRW